MKKFSQFLSEAVNIAGDFNGNLYINSQESEPEEVGESYVADVMWEGKLYRMELMTKSGVPTKQDLGEQLQGDYPGAVVHQIYPAQTKNPNIKNVQRYQPERLTWSD